MLSILLLLCATVVAGFNGLFGFMHWRNQRTGVKENVSTVPLVVQILVLLAVLSPELTSAGLPLPGWVYWLAALADVAFLKLLLIPWLYWRSKRPPH